jgi:IS30 family transposase
MSEKTSYQQLQPEERLTIASLHLQGSSMRAMARILGRSPGTISRELMRNSSSVGYTSVPAAALCSARRSASRPRAKLCPQSVCWRIVLTLLEWKWSPQQISGTLKRMYPTDSNQHVSHETIYTAIYAQPRGELRRQLIACLRHGHSTRMPRARGTDRRGQIPDMVSIHVRPPEIEDRLLPGHWEGDFIKGADNQSSVGVLVERTSRLVLLAKMEDATAASALAGFSAKLNSIVAPLRQSFTLRPRQRNVAPSGTHRRHRRECVLLRPAQSLATRYLRKHQRVAAPVFA